MDNKKRYIEIDYLKGMAVILMILGHSIAGRNLGMENNRICSTVYDFIYSFHMSLFFAASGFLYKSVDNYFSYIRKKAQRLLIPYGFFCLAIIFIRMVLPGFTVEEASSKELLLSILLYGGNLWFLYVLFFIFLVFPLLDGIINKVKYGGGIILLLLTILECFIPNIKLFEVSDLLFYFIPFTVGRIFRLTNCYDRLKNIKYKNIYIICGLLIHIILFAVCVHLNIDCIKRLISAIVSLVGCFWIFLMACEIRWDKARYSLSELGSYSLPLYLFNGYFIAASRILLKVLGIHNIIIIIISHFVMGLIINYWFCRLMLKIKFFALLCGGTVKHDSKV